MVHYGVCRQQVARLVNPPLTTPRHTYSTADEQKRNWISEQRSIQKPSPFILILIASTILYYYEQIHTPIAIGNKYRSQSRNTSAAAYGTGGHGPTNSTHGDAPILRPRKKGNGGEILSHLSCSTHELHPGHRLHLSFANSRT